MFLKHIEAPEEEIERIADKIYQRRLNEMFQMVDGYSVKKTREQTRIEVTKELSKKYEKEKIKLIGKMLKRGDTINEIADFLETSVEEVENAKKELNL